MYPGVTLLAADTAGDGRTRSARACSSARCSIVVTSRISSERSCRLRRAIQTHASRSSATIARIPHEDLAAIATATGIAVAGLDSGVRDRRRAGGAVWTRAGVRAAVGIRRVRPSSARSARAPACRRCCSTRRSRARSAVTRRCTSRRTTSRAPRRRLTRLLFDEDSPPARAAAPPRVCSRGTRGRARPPRPWPRWSRRRERRSSIVIVSHNTRSDLENCLRSLHEHPPHVTHEIVVVDNASRDGSVDAVRSRVAGGSRHRARTRTSASRRRTTRACGGPRASWCCC